MAFDKMIVKKLLKKFDDVPFVVKFPDGEELLDRLCPRIKALFG